MELQVGINSYVNVKDADDYISSRYLSKNAARVAWEILEVEDKATALIKACDFLNSLKYTGKRKNQGQKVEFPRVSTYGAAGVVFQPVFNPAFDQGLGGVSAHSSDGLDKAIMAQCEYALWSAYLDKDITNASHKVVAGLTSKKAGPISETYDTRSLRDIVKEKVAPLLSEWLSDSSYVI